MQCVSCHFENMPGSGRCARCGASLALATAVVNVHPPRAGRLSRLTPSLWRLWYGMGRLGERTAPLAAACSSSAEGTNFNLPTMLRCVVPGWPQYYRGDRPRAFVYLFSYLALFLPGALLAGSWLGSILLGLAGAMHIVAVCDAVVTAFATLNDRIAFTIATGLVLCFALYLPAGWLVSRVATPISINAALPPFERGQVLWYNRSKTTKLGDLVLYELPRLTAQGRTSGGAPANFVFQGPWIGRVLATPGQTVTYAEGHWSIDGIRSQWQPAQAPNNHQGASWLVPVGHVFIAPEGLVPAGASLQSTTLEQLYLTPTEHIAGTIYFRSLPLTQMSTIH